MVGVVWCGRTRPSDVRLLLILFATIPQFRASGRDTDNRFFIRVGPLYRNGKGRHKGEGGQHHDNHYWSLLCGPMAETETSPRSWLAPAVAFGEASGLWPLDAVKGFGGIEKPVVYSPSLWSKPCNMAPTLLEEG